MLAVIPLYVLLKLPAPEHLSGFWRRGLATPRMAMPKTAMDEHDDFVLGQDDVRGTRQVSPVKPEPVAETMQQAADLQLWGGVPTADRGHVPTA